MTRPYYVNVSVAEELEYNALPEETRKLVAKIWLREIDQYKPFIAQAISASGIGSAEDSFRI